MNSPLYPSLILPLLETDGPMASHHSGSSDEQDLVTPTDTLIGPPPSPFPLHGARSMSPILPKAIILSSLGNASRSGAQLSQSGISSKTANLTPASAPRRRLSLARFTRPRGGGDADSILSLRSKASDAALHASGMSGRSQVGSMMTSGVAPSISGVAPSLLSVPIQELSVSLGDPFSIDFCKLTRSHTVRRVRIEYVDQPVATPTPRAPAIPTIPALEVSGPGEAVGEMLDEHSGPGRIPLSLARKPTISIARANTLSTTHSNALPGHRGPDEPLRSIRDTAGASNTLHGRLFLQILGIDLEPGRRGRTPSRICVQARDPGEGRQITSEIPPGDLATPYEFSIPTMEEGTITLRVHKSVRAIAPIRALIRTFSAIRRRGLVSSLSSISGAHLHPEHMDLPIEAHPATPGRLIGGVMITLRELERFRGFAVVVPLGGRTGSIKIRGFYMPSIPLWRTPRCLEDALRRRYAHDSQFPDHPLHAGPLSQCGGGMHFWRERWFELRGLRLHAHDVDTRAPRAWYDLRAYRYVRPTLPSELPGPWGFILGFGDATEIRFQAKNEAARDEWIHLIKETGKARRADMGIWEGLEDDATILARMWG